MTDNHWDRSSNVDVLFTVWGLLYVLWALHILIGRPLGIAFAVLDASIAVLFGLGYGLASIGRLPPLGYAVLAVLESIHVLSLVGSWSGPWYSFVADASAEVAPAVFLAGLLVVVLALRRATEGVRDGRSVLSLSGEGS